MVSAEMRHSGFILRLLSPTLANLISYIYNMRKLMKLRTLLLIIDNVSHQARAELI